MSKIKDSLIMIFGSLIIVLILFTIRAVMNFIEFNLQNFIIMSGVLYFFGLISMFLQTEEDKKDYEAEIAMRDKIKRIKEDKMLSDHEKAIAKEKARDARINRFLLEQKNR